MAILVAVGVIAFVILGAVGVLILSDWTAKRQRRKASEAEREHEADRDVW